MIEIVRLEPKEFPQLSGIGDGYIPNERSIAVVARNDRRLVGRIFVVAPAHIEGVFIEKAWRNGFILQELADAAEIEARSEGITRLFAYASDEQMDDYILRLGYHPLPWRVLVKEIA